MVERCMKCGENVDNSLPMCSSCRTELKDFQKLTDFLNEFDGKKEDALWLIGSEIADRQCLVAGSCRLARHLEHGAHLDVPSGKPFTRRNVEELEKLYRAKNILKEYYGI